MGSKGETDGLSSKSLMPSVCFRTSFKLDLKIVQKPLNQFLTSLFLFVTKNYTKSSLPAFHNLGITQYNLKSMKVQFRFFKSSQLQNTKVPSPTKKRPTTAPIQCRSSGMSGILFSSPFKHQRKIN